MDLKSLPKIKDVKNKIKVTFCITQDSYDTYMHSKAKGYDTTQRVVELIEEYLSNMRDALNQNNQK
jgi:hypothetical protein